MTLDPQDLKYSLMRLAKELEAEGAVTHDLWTWLPSHDAAKKAHGDYASEFLPSTVDVLREAATVLSQVRGYALSDEDKERFACPCGEPHDEPNEAETT